MKETKIWSFEKIKSINFELDSSRIKEGPNKIKNEREVTTDNTEI